MAGAGRVSQYGKSAMDGKRFLASRRCASLLVPVFCLLSAGCGQEKGSPPILLSLERYNSNCFLTGFDQGMTSASGVVQFADPDGDALLLRVSTRVCGEGTWTHIDTLKKDLMGMSSGALYYFGSIITNCLSEEQCPAGAVNDRVEVSMFDGEGQQSNILSSEYSVSCVYPCP